MEFFLLLEAAAPELRFFPQVCMAALIEPTEPKSDRKADRLARRANAQKMVDFVAQRRSDGAIVAIIQLDDRSHDADKDKDQERDAMLNVAGYKTVRWHSKTKPDAQAIRKELL